MGNDLREQQLKKAMASSNEFCVVCYCDMGFPKSLSVDHTRRYQNGARYIGDGAGQICGHCDRKPPTSVA